MRFRDTYLYAHLKQASYTGGLIASGIDRVPYGRQTREVVRGIGGDVADLGRTGVSLGTEVADLTRRGILTPVAIDAGTRFGRSLGDVFGKLNPEADNYDDRDIISLLNQQEEVALLQRETERLERLARIRARKKKRMREAADRAVRSPFI